MCFLVTKRRRKCEFPITSSYLGGGRREREKERKKNKERKKERKGERVRKKERQRQRQTDRQTDRERERKENKGINVIHTSTPFLYGHQ